MNQINDTKAKAEGFHVYQDTEFAFKPVLIDDSKKKEYFIIQEREVSYRFYLHQHPYVQQLVQRLLRKGTSGLQAADTEYNTRIRLTNSTIANGSSGRSVQIPAGEILHLFDGATATLNGTVIRFAGRKVLKLSDESLIKSEINATLTIPSKTIVRRGNGETVTMKADVTATLVDGLPLPVLYSEIFTPTHYKPSKLVQHSYPVKDLDFTSSGAYSTYNWELFYHVPIMIAIHLSKNQRYAEAQRWFHFLFDPTDDSDGPTPERFWKVRPFQYTDVKKIEEILVNLATGADADLRNETIHSIEAWKDSPFRPHVIARYRQQAYMYKTVMSYLDNLIAWGDSLFRQDTGEAIDEAMMVYVLAANILGPRPQPVPGKGSMRPQTYANLRQDINKFGVVMRDVEADLPFDLTPYPTDNVGDNDRLATLRSLGKALYFCVPRNDKLLSYWDTVADRLFKIHNSLNFQGTFRQLALFEPPIDPAMLARAATAGLDVGAVINGLNQPLPLVRFQLLIQKAAEICQEVKSLGNNLLSAMEKEDGEAMTILRAKHERVVMEMVEHVKYGQLQEAIKSKEGLFKSLSLAVQRYTYYERQLGKMADDIEKAIPELGTLDKDTLNKMKFSMKEPEVAPREIEVDIVQGFEALTGGLKFSSYEFSELTLMEAANTLQTVAGGLDLAASPLSVIPQFQVRVTPWGLGAGGTFGGEQLSKVAAYMASMSRTVAGALSGAANTTSKIGSYARREQDWAFQSNLAAGEITQVFKQLRAAEIREAIAEQELKNHRQQMKHAEEIEQFLNEEGTEKKGKKTNKALYAWMKREVKGLYAQCFQFAFDIAKKAERALQHELGNTELSYLQFGYLAGKEGLLAGEKLYLDIKRMEMAYLDLNQREYEITKHISLLQVNPLAILQLRTTGHCTLQLPEELFDMDGSTYFRRIKTLALSIPCVTGPYASVNCKLTLLKSTIRKSPVIGDGYGRTDAEDARFSDNFGSLQSIITSSAQNDSGMFETNLRDERYLPFENSGVISEWQLELPANPSRDDPCQFDYETISDVIMHIRYTAREGGELLRKSAMDNIKTLITQAKSAGQTRLFSMRYEFPSEWAKFQSQTIGANQRYELSFNLRKEHYPFWSQERLDNVERVDILACSSKSKDQIQSSIVVYDKVNDQGQSAKKDTLNKDITLGNLLVGKFSGGSTGLALPASPVTTITIFLADRSISDLWIAVTWNGN